MSEKMLVVSGKTLIRFLQSLGYEVARQRGSHIRLVKPTIAGNHKLFIPNHETPSQRHIIGYLKQNFYLVPD